LLRVEPLLALCLALAPTQCAPAQPPLFASPRAAESPTGPLHFIENDLPASRARAARHRLPTRPPRSGIRFAIWPTPALPWLRAIWKEPRSDSPAWWRAWPHRGPDGPKPSQVRSVDPTCRFDVRLPPCAILCGDWTRKGRGRLLQARARAMPDAYEPSACLVDVFSSLKRYEEPSRPSTALAPTYAPRRLGYLATKAVIPATLGKRP